MWTIHDFLAYTLILGQVGRGYAACLVCGKGTFAEHFNEAHKTIYLGHQRWLRENHKWQSAQAAFSG